MRKIWIVSLACLGACSSRPKPDDIAREERQLKSLAADKALFDQVEAAGHLTRAFAAGHARYLHDAITEHLKKLGQ